MRVMVCVWEAAHTVARAEAQEEALQNGVVLRLLKTYGKGTREFREAMAARSLTSAVMTPDGPECSVCGSLMDEVLSRPGIDDRLEALRDVAQDLSQAITRTRQARRGV